MSTTVTYKGNTLTTVSNTTKTLKTAGKYMEGDVTLVDDSKPTHTDVMNSAGGRTITINDGVITTDSKVAHILPTGMYNLPSGATITNESNMYTTVDSETYATVLSKSFPSVGYFDFSVLPDNAVVESFELLFKTGSSEPQNTLSSSRVLCFGNQSVLSNTTFLPFRQSPEITSIDLEGVTWNDIISNKSILNLVIPSDDDRDSRYYGIEFRVTYSLPINKTVYGTTVLVDLTADTVTPESLLEGYTAHDKSGALITGTATGGGTGGVTQDQDGYLVLDDEGGGGDDTDFANTIMRSGAVTRIPDSVTSIGNYAFYNCAKLALTELPSGVTSIGVDAFYGCTNLALTELPSGVTSIGNYAFRGCIGLQQLDAQNVGTINANAFNACYHLTELVLRKSDTACTLSNANAFLYTPMRGYNGMTGTIYVPQALIETYKAATNWSRIYNEGHLTFAAIEGSEYERD